MKYRFDVAISFAGENRDFARDVATGLKEKNVEVFFDEFYEPDTWGKNLTDLFKEVFRNRSQHCIMILSDHYVEKEWTILESNHAIARFIEQRGNEAYILPVRLDGFDGDVPGLPTTLQYISAKSTEPQKIVNAFLEKHNKSPMRSLVKRPLSDLTRGKTISKRSRERELPIPGPENGTCGQDEFSPVKEPKLPKRKHEADSEKEYSSSTQGTQMKPRIPTELVDREIEKEVGVLRRSRFYSEFEAVQFSSNLAKKLVEGEFSGGTDIVRSRSLAWCVRILLLAKELPDDAEKHLDTAKSLKLCEEIKIAEAFIFSRKGDEKTALIILDEIDSPMSKSAAFMIVANHKGNQAAIDWLETEGDANALDPEGKFFVLIYKLFLAQWDSARDFLERLTDQDLCKVPALHNVVAMIHLLRAVPEELREILYERPPLQESEFRLASDADAVLERRKACEYFVKAMEAAEELGFSGTAKTCEEYAFWLELSDPEKSDEGKRQLATKFRNPETSLHLVRLATRFGIDFDPQAVEGEIERQISLNGGITYEAARARFALVFTKKTLNEVADYVDRYQDEITRCSDEKSVQLLKINMYSEAGQLDRAKKCLAALKKQGLSETEYKDIRRVIAEAERGDRIGILKRRFKKTGSLSDLVTLVNELGGESRWEDLCEYGRILFERTGSSLDAERLANAFSKTRQTAHLVEFVEANKDLLEQSRYLQMIYCRALHAEGFLLEARSRFDKLDHDPDDDDYRALRIKLAVSMGDWNELSAFVADELSEKNNRSAQDLISVAQLAAYLGLATAKDLTLEAVAKDGEDPEVLGTACVMASEAGWDDDPKVAEWLEKALALSGDDGPVRRLSLKKFLDQYPAWNQNASDARKKLISGEIPMFAAGWLLNESLFDLMFLPALANMSEKDPRRRVAVPAYSGKRLPTRINTGGKVGIDATALITLNFLGLLDEALDIFSEVHIPHSTLSWLFDEKRRAGFRQPSRARDARKVSDLLATGKLEKLEEVSAPDSDLSAQVGTGLATLITEAEKSGKSDGVQRIVVRPAPVYPPASLMEEEADMTAHAGVLCGCMSVVKKLRQKGQITAEEERKAGDYLRLSEKTWPDEPKIQDGAMLYLDDPALSCFTRLGMLEKLRSAGFHPFVSPVTKARTEALLLYESVSSNIRDSLESIRFALNSRIESGKIRIARQLDAEEGAGMQPHEHPTAGIFPMAGTCDAIVVDDRFINGNPRINFGGDDAPVFSTLDVLETLVFSGSITREEWMEYRTRLRAAGYFFIPVASKELKSHLDDSAVQDGKVVETAELKAVRENILHVQMNNWRQLPEEWFWLEECATAFTHVLNGLWTTDADFSEALARSDWIVGQINFPALIHALARKNGNDPYGAEFGKHIMAMLMSGQMVLRQSKEEYWTWLEKRILVLMKEQFPDSYAWIVEVFQEEIARKTDMYINMETSSMNIKSEAAKAVLARSVPPLLQDTLLDKPAFREEYGLEERRLIFFSPSNVSILRSTALDAIRNFFSGAGREEATDMDGLKWKVQNDAEDGQLPRLVFARGKNRYPVPAAFVLLSPNRETRLRFLEKTASEFNFPSESRKAWRKTLARRPLENDEIEEFQQDFLDTSASMAEFIRGKTEEPFIVLRSLVPSSRRYFHRLVGKYDGSATIRDYAKNGIREVFRELSSWDPYRGFLSSLLLSSHSSLTAEIQVDNLSDDELVRAYDFLENHGDPVSRLGAVEVGLRILPSRPDIEPRLVRLIGQVRDEDVDGTASGFKLFSALFILAHGEMSRSRSLCSEPPFYKRLAALSHAALIHREMASSSIDAGLFQKTVIPNQGWEHCLQALVDMRREPLWNPIFWLETQIKENFLGRIIQAARKYKRNIKNSELFELVLGTHPESVCSVANLFLPHVPSPLDANEELLQSLPAKLSDAIETQLSAEQVCTSSFTALVNSAAFFQLGPKHVELAVNALKSCDHRLASTEGNKWRLLETVNGLAMVSAIARSRTLADELRILMRRNKRNGQYVFSIKDETLVCVAAAASRADLNEWKEFVGGWMTEMALDDLKDDDAEKLQAQLQYLCHIVPDLQSSCARAYAALKALPQRRGAVVSVQEPVS